MSQVGAVLRSRFRTPGGQLLLHGAKQGEEVTHAVMLKDIEAQRWAIIGVFGDRVAAARKLKEQTATAPASECVIVECEPY